MSAYDGAVDDEVLKVAIIRHRRQDAVPGALGAPPAEPSKHAVSRAEHLWQVAPGRSSRSLVADDVRRHPLPLLIIQDQPIQNTHDCLQKTALHQTSNRLGIPSARAS